MKLSIVTPKGLSFEGEVDHIVVDGDNGQLAILKNHIPIVVSIRDGFVKHVIDNEELFHVIYGGLLEFNDNVATVIAQETVANDGELTEESLEKINNAAQNFLEMYNNLN